MIKYTVPLSSPASASSDSSIVYNMMYYASKWMNRVHQNLGPGLVVEPVVSDDGKSHSLTLEVYGPSVGLNFLGMTYLQSGALCISDNSSSLSFKVFDLYQTFRYFNPAITQKALFILVQQYKMTGLTLREFVEKAMVVTDSSSAKSGASSSPPPDDTSSFLKRYIEWTKNPVGPAPTNTTPATTASTVDEATVTRIYNALTAIPAHLSLYVTATDDISLERFKQLSPPVVSSAVDSSDTGDDPEYLWYFFEALLNTKKRLLELPGNQYRTYTDATAQKVISDYSQIEAVSNRKGLDNLCYASTSNMIGGAKDRNIQIAMNFLEIIGEADTRATLNNYIEAAEDPAINLDPSKLTYYVEASGVEALVKGKNFTPLKQAIVKGLKDDVVIKQALNSISGSNPSQNPNMFWDKGINALRKIIRRTDKILAAAKI